MVAVAQVGGCLGRWSSGCCCRRTKVACQQPLQWGRRYDEIIGVESHGGLRWGNVFHFYQHRPGQRFLSSIKFLGIHVVANIIYVRLKSCACVPRLLEPDLNGLGSCLTHQQAYFLSPTRSAPNYPPEYCIACYCRTGNMLYIQFLYSHHIFNVFIYYFIIAWVSHFFIVVKYHEPWFIFNLLQTSKY